MAGLNDLLVIRRANNGQVDDSSIPIEMREWFKKVYRQPTTTEPITTEQPINIDEYGGTEDAIIADQIHQLEQQEKRSDEYIVQTDEKKDKPYVFIPTDNLPKFLTGAEGFLPEATLSIESKLNPKLTKTYDIGHGHKLTPEEFKSGLVYGIRIKDDEGNFIPISESDSLKILHEDIKEKGRITKIEYENITNKKFSDLSKVVQDLLVESTFNGLSPNDALGLVTAASKNDIKDIIKNMTDRFTGPKENRVILGERNTRLWNTYLDKLAKTLSKEDYEAMKQLVTIKRQRKKSGGMVERNYYDYAPRNI